MPSSSPRHPEKCPVPNCGISFRDFDARNKDHLIHSHNTFYHWLVYCTPCGQLFDSPAALTAHSDNKHPFCLLCRQRFNSSAEREAHFRKEHQVTYCSKCSHREGDGYSCLCGLAQDINEKLKDSGKKQSQRKYRGEGDFIPTNFPSGDAPGSSNKGSSTGDSHKSRWDYRDSSKSKTKDRKPYRHTHSYRYESNGASYEYTSTTYEYTDDGSCDATSSSDDESNHTYRSGYRRSNSKAKPRSEEQKQTPSPPPSADPPAADYYSLIGISSTASHSDVLKAIKKARIANHPDRFMNKNLSPQDLEKVVERSKCIGQACDVLEDPSARRVYDAKLQSDRLYASSKSAKPTSSDYSSRYNSDDPRAWPGTPPRASTDKSSSKGASTPKSSSGYSSYKGYESSAPKPGTGSPLRNEYKPERSSTTASSKKDEGSGTRSSGSSRRAESSKARPSDRHRNSSRRLSDVDEEMTDV